MVAFTAGKPGLEPSGAATPDAGISSAVRCAIVMYGPTDLPTRRQIAADGTSRAAPRAMGAALKIFGAAADGDEVLWIASPVTHVAKDSPPVLMLHGRAGITVDYAQSEEFARVLKERGVKYQFVLIEGIGHTFAFERWVKIKWRTTGAPSGSNFWRAICNNAPARLSALSPTRGLGHCFRSDKAAWGPVAPPSRKIRATDGGATHCFATNHRARRPTPDAEKVRNGP